MAVKLRLTRMGRKKKPFYRVVAAHSEAKRDGRFIEILGTYDPLKEPAECKMDAERVKYWLGQGAVPTETVNGLIKKFVS